MKTRRFDFNFRPLQINIGFAVDGSVPNKQNYDADTGTYTPDYTLTPLIIQPQVSCMDKDEFLAAGSINHQLANVKWYEIVGGVSTLIESTNTSYEVIASGGQAGRIKVKKNAQPKVPITLEFHAEYSDPRTGQLHTIVRTFSVTCGNSTVFAPQLVLDAADQTLYNPLTDPDTQVVHASLRLGVNECATVNRLFVWEIFRADSSTWTEVGTDTTLDYDVTVAADGASCTVNRNLMGTELYLRCRAKYDIGGNPSSIALTDAAPCKVVTFVRRIPKFEFDVTGVPVNIPVGILAIAPEASIWDANGAIQNPERELLPLWYIATNKASGTLSYTQVAHGLKPTVPTKAMSTSYGAVVGLDVKDVGPLCAFEDTDGAVFEDADGNVILIK
ncbi:hypothetical protein [uncultured Duncaniella sp.]|uniref:hypothetical protein n=1 Tax=uncultured Duncaniella sp. TaxID=2768039 RepID=UPI0025B5DD24|nr:hypothetical protein [uncultured Duncaniella sp.]